MSATVEAFFTVRSGGVSVTCGAAEEPLPRWARPVSHSRSSGGERIVPGALLPAKPSGNRPFLASSAMNIYDSIGGPPAVSAAVDDFYLRVLADPALAPFFAGIDMQ